MSEVLIVADKLQRIFQQGGRPAIGVQSASFRVVAGDRIAIVGPSGCGKSTLLHLMGGLERATTGTIAWPGLGAFDDLRPAKIAMIFQGPSLIPELTARENVTLPSLLDDGDGQRDVDSLAALRLFDLEALADKLPEEMSGGQMQRVAMARAVAGRPAVILADEPTGQVDQATRDDLLDRLLTHLSGTPTALIVTTHDPVVSERMQTIWRMQGGVLTNSTMTLGVAA